MGHFETIVKHLTETLNELVDSLKMQEDKGKEREWLNFEDVFKKTNQIFIGTILESNAIVTADFSKADKIEYPRSYLESIMLNLLSNALKYRSPARAPEIHFLTEETSEGLTLKISDNGLGMDLKKYGGKLFGLNKTFHRHAEAKGIGLFMTKIQIEAMGGHISAESEVDKGTTFKVVF
jgi:signal transduction histidine kinase